MLKETLDLHIETAAPRVGIARNWGFKTPCSRWRFLDSRGRRARHALYLDARRLPFSRRLTYFNEEFFGAPNAPARDLLQKIAAAARSPTNSTTSCANCGCATPSARPRNCPSGARLAALPIRVAVGRRALFFHRCRCRHTGDWRVRVVTVIAGPRPSWLCPEAGALQAELRQLCVFPMRSIDACFGLAAPAVQSEALRFYNKEVPTRMLRYLV